MIEPLYLDGTSWTPDMIEALRRAIIRVRDDALKENDFGVAVPLSHNIALLGHLAKHTKDIS